MEEITMTLKGVDNEATSAPYWLILDPSQNMRCNIHEMAGGISGPFFCRDDAERYLEATRYNFSSRARVYCCSGHHSLKYERLCRSLRVGYDTLNTATEPKTTQPHPRPSKPDEG